MENVDYKKINKESWNERTDVHIQSDFYNNENFIKGESSLNPIELELLGDIKDKSILHLQCHFGQDTISLSRMGAITTGVDLSDKAILRANELAETTQTDTKFICCDIYDLPQHLNRKFDIVYTSYGTIGWLPDINKWATIVAQFLKPQGKFVFVEFHPVIWMLDDDLKKIEYRYFNSGPIIENEQGTYTDSTIDLSLKSVSWNHSLGEVVNSLINQGLELNLLNEYDYSPYNCFSNTIEIAPKQYRIKHLDNKIPMTYALSATKK